MGPSGCSCLRVCVANPPAEELWCKRRQCGPTTTRTHFRSEKGSNVAKHIALQAHAGRLAVCQASLATRPELPESLGSPSSPSLPTVSAVLPVTSNVMKVAVVAERVGDALARAGWPHEIICVDYQSNKGALQFLRAMAAERQELRPVAVQRRNPSQAAAVVAGLDAAAGDYVVTLSGDARTDPADVLRLLRTLHWGKRVGERTALPSLAADLEGEAQGEKEPERDGGGYDIVWGWRHAGGRGASLLIAAVNVLLRMATGVALRDYDCSLQAYRSSLLRSLRSLGELPAFVPAAAAASGALFLAQVEVQAPAPAPPLRLPLLLPLASSSLLSRLEASPARVFGLLSLLLLLAAAAFLAAFASSVLHTAPAYGTAMALSVALPQLTAALQFAAAALVLFGIGVVGDMCRQLFVRLQEERGGSARSPGM